MRAPNIRIQAEFVAALFWVYTIAALNWFMFVFSGIWKGWLLSLVSPVSSHQLAVLAFTQFCNKSLKIEKEMHERQAEKTAIILVKWETAGCLT